MALKRLTTRRMVTAITGLVVPVNQRHFGAKVAARILAFYCLSFCRRSNQKERYEHVALEVYFKTHYYKYEICLADNVHFVVETDRLKMQAL